MDIYSEFKNPQNNYRGKPFWSWNGKLEKEELIRQIHIMQEMGFGGFFMHSRTGLETEYLGEEWFQLINACTDEAEKLGLEAWLYDEDRWPSGSAGGMVTKSPEYRMRSLHMKKKKGEAMVWTEDVVAAYLVSIDGLSLRSYRRIDENTPQDEYRTHDILIFVCKEMDSSPFYNGYTYLDTLNPEATRAFIESTHVRYGKECGSRFGSAIKGIFTDEPYRGRLMTHFGSSETEGTEGLINSVPWTDKLADSFANAFGYDLLERLPELFLWNGGENVSQVKWHYVEILQQMFLDNFAKPIDAWCRENNLILTGHILHEDSLSAQTAVSGSMMRYYEYMEYPGIDLLGEHNKNYWVAKQVTSVARQLGKKWLLSEMYGCTGWQFTFEGHKHVGDWQALFGINIRCHHLSWYTMKGQAKRDYPASILHQSAWWREYKYVEDYFSRIHVFMTAGQPVCSTLVVNPVESVWSVVYPGWCSGLEAADETVKELEKKYSKLFQWLCGAQIDFDYGDEEMLSRHCRIEREEGAQPVFCVGEAKYKQVIVSGLITLRSTTADLLEQFMEAGGKVIFAGELPAYLDALKSDRVKSIAEKAVRIPFALDALIAAAEPDGVKPVCVINADGTENMDIFVQARKEGERLYIMLLNVNREKEYGRVRIMIEAEGYAERWDCRTGEKHFLGVARRGKVAFEADFAPGGEFLCFVSGQKGETVKESPVTYKAVAKLPLDSSFSYSLDEPNVCVLDFAKFRMDGGDWQEADEILKVDQKIRAHYGLPYRAGNMLQPWFSKKRIADTKGTIQLAFAFQIEVIPEGEIYLGMEAPEEFSVALNDKRIDTAQQWGWWVDKCIKKISLDKALLKRGANTVELTAVFQERLDLEAVYLLGNFGVRLDGYIPTLIELPPKLHIGDIVNQGLPFYSGRVTYVLKTGNTAAENERITLKLGKFGAACIKVQCFGSPEKMLAWPPYEVDITDEMRTGKEIKLEVVLTRRNTFGPLHLFPPISPVYGPGHFTTVGSRFSKNPMLLETGLLEMPELIVSLPET